MKRKALFAGTFDPFTIGHDAIVRRSLQITDELIIGIGVNPEKNTLFSLSQRMENISRIYESLPNISVASFHTLTVDFAKQSGVDFIIKGIRNLHDFEFEKNMSDINRLLSGIETVFLFSDPQYASISSSLIRELIMYNKDISNLIPVTK